jgi:hypothetical protein
VGCRTSAQNSTEIAKLDLPNTKEARELEKDSGERVGNRNAVEEEVEKEGAEAARISHPSFVSKPASRRKNRSNFLAKLRFEGANCPEKAPDLDGPPTPHVRQNAGGQTKVRLIFFNRSQTVRACQTVSAAGPAEAKAGQTGTNWADTAYILIPG